MFPLHAAEFQNQPGNVPSLEYWLAWICRTALLSDSMRKLWCLLLLFSGFAVAQDSSTPAFQFAVSGDSRNCGDVVMPAIAAGARECEHLPFVGVARLYRAPIGAVRRPTGLPRHRQS